MNYTQSELIELIENCEKELDVNQLINIFEINKCDKNEIESVSKAIRSNISKIIEKFYIFVEKREDLATFFTGPEHIEKMKLSFSISFERIVVPEIDKNYLRSRLKIGLVHQRIGLPEISYLEGLTELQKIMCSFIGEGCNTVLKPFFNLERFLTLYAYSKAQKLQIKKNEMKYKELIRMTIHDINNPLMVLLPQIQKSKKVLETIEKSITKINDTTKSSRNIYEEINLDD